MTLTVEPGSYSVVRFLPDAANAVLERAGAALAASRFSSVTRTKAELSIVCESGLVEAMPFADFGNSSAFLCGECRIESGWSLLSVEGPLDFGLTGVLSSVCAPLAEAGVSVFTVSTYDTDWIMVKSERLGRAAEALRAAGFTVNYSA
jgi:hypothetical protein